MSCCNGVVLIDVVEVFTNVYITSNDFPFLIAVFGRPDLGRFLIGPMSSKFFTIRKIVVFVMGLRFAQNVLAKNTYYFSN